MKKVPRETSKEDYNIFVKSRVSRESIPEFEDNTTNSHQSETYNL